ncbi:hypothetical protein [Deinococcus soli (ex Cha et al. 2016)]|uniref:Uncharacterized protein n=2 Tax=Deinococcus soli (ex Cha et al. 2016) TaxID=1309411 RepID=A0AAE3XCN0_9DEIO|nr:hypothetical protein [Deinococcus soli (ex Cha et al. 2016)]MDR6218596.1 hypothetical protein [Deinococcus soli (ex Cha et al. 2016)]MDR6328393.1 hypothetical protein [Deinococcus soli (ex Cha et al. 2016)]MDR6753004.1 hypothetical protein [Deinococcus soli (ex Cha et al. 2016)]
MMDELLTRHPGGVGFYNTRALRGELGLHAPHELDQALTRLKHSGFVVLRGEGLSGATQRWTHRFGTHNWTPEMVIIVPRAVFKARQARAPGRGFLSVGAFEQTVPFLNVKPEGGGRRPRLTGEYAAAQATRGAP